jgi:hypothetical protein
LTATVLSAQAWIHGSATSTPTISDATPMLLAD